MYNSWHDDLNDSVKAFEAIRETHLPDVIQGRIYRVEGDPHEVMLLLDTKSGVDYVRETNDGIQGIAARAQWGRPWNTFTIRSARHTGSETELSKRMKAIDLGYVLPALTLQAYFDNRNTNSLLSMAVVYTSDLYRFVAEHPEYVGRQKSDNDFIYVRWSDLRKCGVKIATKLCSSEPIQPPSYDDIEQCAEEGWRAS